MGGAFVGRDAQLEILDQALAEARGGAGRFVLVTGEPGIGKTRLGDELTRRAEAGACRVAWGRSWEGEGTPAYWPWIQVLRQLELPPLESAAAGDPGQARFRLFDQVAQALRSAAVNTPLLLVLDDLHAADVSSLLLLQFVARNLRGSRVLLVGTSREITAASTEETRELIAQVSREALQLPLGRLARADLAAWVSAAAPALADRVDSVFSTSEGNPLFVEELLAAARRRPGLTVSTAQLPLGIREAIRAHLGLLSERTQWLLEGASALGREFSLATLGAITSQSAAQTQPALEEAIASGVLFSAGEGRLKFSHVLLRDELYAHIAPTRAAELHRAAARFLRPQPEHRMEAAHHFVLGAPAEDSEAATQAVLAAMQEASSHFAFEDAARLGERALEALSLRPADAVELWISVGEARILGGKSEVGKAACLRATELAIQTSDSVGVARAALAAATELTFRRDDDNIALLRRALAMQPPGDSKLTAQVMARLAAALVPPTPPEYEELLRLRAESKQMARRLGDDATLFLVLRLSATTFPEQIPARERLGLNAEAIELAVRLRQVPRIVSLLGWQVACWLELGDIDGALREAANAERLLAGFDQPHYRWRVPMIRAMLAELDGRFDEADRLARETYQLCRDHGLIEGAMIVGVFMMTMPYVRGDTGNYGEVDAELSVLLGSAPMAVLFRSIPNAALGRTALVADAMALARKMPMEVIPGPAGLALATIRADLSEHAEFFYDVVKARSRDLPILFGPGGTTLVGPTELILGQLAAMTNRDALAISHFEQAIAFAARIRSPPYRAHAELGWAEVLAKKADAAATGHAQAALQIARVLEMRAVAERAEKLCAAAPSVAPAPVAASAPGLSVSREGEQWVLAAGASRVVLRDGKGLGYLEALVQQSHREVHVLELVGAEDEGDAGPMLDAKAKQAYRERAESVRDELEEAVRNADLGRAERMREELEALASELSRAVGLGGRDRRAGSTSERARINVQRRLRDVVRRVSEQDASLGRHLELSLRTGVFCLYAPTWP